jgi:hypothetical protein
MTAKRLALEKLTPEQRAEYNRLNEAAMKTPQGAERENALLALVNFCEDAIEDNPSILEDFKP